MSSPQEADSGQLEYYYFDGMTSWDIFASTSYFTLGVLGVILNLRALVVVVKNTNLSDIIKSYLFADHLFRIISDLILFYPAMCPLIRIDKVSSAFPSYSESDDLDFWTEKRRSICVVAESLTMWGSGGNQVFAICFVTIMHFLELLQFAISLNRWLTVSSGGRYLPFLSKTRDLQIDLMLTITWIAFYKFTIGNYMYFDDAAYSLVSSEFKGYISRANGQVAKAIRIVAAVITLLSILLDWSTFVLLKRHLEKSRKITQSDAKTGAEIRLAKQLLVNHIYAIFVAACSCYILVSYWPIDGLRRLSQEWMQHMIDNFQFTQHNWFVFLATTFFPALGNVVNGLMTIIFLSPLRRRLMQTKSVPTVKSELSTGR